MDLGKWVYNVLIGIDQLANALTLGEPDETISSRTGYLQGAISRFLSLFEKDHSLKSIEYTPWGTVDPHELSAIHCGLAADWNALIAVMDEKRDLDKWPVATKEAAQRALERLRSWKGRDRWQQRMERDLDIGDRFQ